MAAQRADAIEWYRVPVPREELKKLTARSDFKASLQTVGFLLLVIATGTVAWIAWERSEAGTFPIWGTVLLVFFHGMMSKFILQGFHELVHYTVFKTRWLGTFFLYLYSFLGWHDPVHFKSSHTRHHLYTLHPPRDREVQLPIGMRLWHYIRAAIVEPQGLYGAFKRTIIKAFGGYTSDWQKEIIEADGEPTRRALVRFNLALLIFHVGIIVVSIVTRQYQLAVLVTFAQFYGRWFQFLCNESQHIGLSDNVPDFRLCCRTFTAGPIVRFLYWNMNYHTEHHMYAAVPCYNLHKLHKIVRPEMPKMTHGLIATWRQIIGILKQQQIDPDYTFKPELPS